MGSAPSRSRQSKVGKFLESGKSGKEELVFNPETGKLEVVNISEVRLGQGRKVVTAMNERGGGGFFICIRINLYMIN